MKAIQSTCMSLNCVKYCEMFACSLYFYSFFHRFMMLITHKPAVTSVLNFQHAELKFVKRTNVRRGIVNILVAGSSVLHSESLHDRGSLSLP